MPQDLDPCRRCLRGQCTICEGEAQAAVESQRVRDARNVGCPSWKATGKEQSQPQRPCRLHLARPQGQGFPSPSELTTGDNMGTRHGTTGFNIYPAGVWSCFGPILPMSPSVLLEMGRFTLP